LYGLKLADLIEVQITDDCMEDDSDSEGEYSPPLYILGAINQWNQSLNQERSQNGNLISVPIQVAIKRNICFVEDEESLL
jgi:hypothetical protein